jgi:hypothetical protein
MESWRLYNTKLGLIDRETIEWCSPDYDRSDSPISVFAFMLSEEDGKYGELPLAVFWTFLNDLMELFTEIRGFNAIGYSSDLITQELAGIRRTIDMWTHTEGHDDALAGFDYTLMVEGTMGVNNLFRTKVHYIWKIIEQKWYQECLPSLLTLSMKEVPGSSLEDRDRLKKIICGTCKGDKDEFVIYCSDFIKQRLVTEHHIRLASTARLAMNPRSGGKIVLDVSDTWRELFPTFFEKADGSFDRFYAAFENECAAFFIEEYLMLPIDTIRFAPLVPNVVMCGNVIASDVLYMFGIDFIQARCVEVEDIARLK